MVNKIKESPFFSANHKKTVKSTEKKPAWHDEDDDDVKVKDVTGTYTKAIGKHGKKETSNENYAQSLRKQFSNLMDRPKWAKLEVSKGSEDSDDEFFRETTDTLATGKSLLLKKGFIESRKLKGTLVLFYLRNHSTFNKKVMCCNIVMQQPDVLFLSPHVLKECDWCSCFLYCLIMVPPHY